MWLIYALAYFLLTTSEMELDYNYQQKLNVRGASQVAKRLET